jgi:hypothetical protein
MDLRALPSTFLIRTVESEAAERTRSAIMRALAHFREANGESPGHPSGERMGRQFFELPQVSAALAAVTSMVSFVETFSARITAQKLRLSLNDQPRVAADALAEIEKQIDRSWADRIKGWNAAMHGDGWLTTKQLADDGGRAVITRLHQVGIRTVGGKLEVDARAVEVCARACRSATLWIDEQVAGASPVAAQPRRSTNLQRP